MSSIVTAFLAQWNSVRDFSAVCARRTEANWVWKVSLWLIKKFVFSLPDFTADWIKKNTKFSFEKWKSCWQTDEMVAGGAQWESIVFNIV